MAHPIPTDLEVLKVLSAASVQWLLPPLLRLGQPLRHLFVLRGVICPTLGGSAPAMMADRHVDAEVDEELHGFVILVPHQLMEDAGGLMGGPVRVDIGPAPEKKLGDLEMIVEDRPSKRGVENLLHTGLSPLQVPADPGIVGGKMIREVAQGRPARRVEPVSHPCEVPIPGGVWQIIGDRPDPRPTSSENRRPQWPPKRCIMDFHVL